MNYLEVTIGGIGIRIQWSGVGTVLCRSDAVPLYKKRCSAVPMPLNCAGELKPPILILRYLIKDTLNTFERKEKKEDGIQLSSRRDLNPQPLNFYAKSISNLNPTTFCLTVDNHKCYFG